MVEGAPRRDCTISAVSRSNTRTVLALKSSGDFIGVLETTTTGPLYKAASSRTPWFAMSSSSALKSGVPGPITLSKFSAVGRKNTVLSAPAVGTMEDQLPIVVSEMSTTPDWIAVGTARSLTSDPAGKVWTVMRPPLVFSTSSLYVVVTSTTS